MKSNIDNDLNVPIAWMIQSVDRQGRAYTDISPVKPSDGMMAQIFRDFKETTLTPLYTNITIPDGFVLVPIEPTEEQWGGLARDIVMWWSFDRPTGSALFKHLSSLGRDIPNWLHQEIKDVDHVPPKGTVAAVIYKAMLDDSKLKGA